MQVSSENGVRIPTSPSGSGEGVPHPTLISDRDQARLRSIEGVSARGRSKSGDKY